MLTFNEVFQRHQYSLSEINNKSQRWFQQQAKLLQMENINGHKLIQRSRDFFVNSIVPGNIYLYRYDPKTKATLAMWDMYPLVLPFSFTSGSFIGLNFHYLSYRRRIQLLDKLMVFSSNNVVDEKTRLKFSWDYIKGLSKFSDAKTCVKKYLTGNITSNIVRIQQQNWATIMMLPVEQFIYK